MGRTNGIIAMGKRDQCRAKGITIYIDFNNHQNAFTDTKRYSGNTVNAFHNQPANILYVEITLNGWFLTNSVLFRTLNKPHFKNLREIETETLVIKGVYVVA